MKTILWVALVTMQQLALCSPEANEHAVAGKRLFEEGNLKGALEKYEAGWKTQQDIDSLKGICYIHMIHRNAEGIGKLIDPIIARAADDLELLKIATAYSIQIKNPDLFRKCLAKTNPDLLEQHPILAIGIARGSILFFGKDGPGGPDGPKDLPKK